jgi:hypothetical protein
MKSKLRNLSAIVKGFCGTVVRRVADCMNKSTFLLYPLAEVGSPLVGQALCLLGTVFETIGSHL